LLCWDPRSQAELGNERQVKRVAALAKCGRLPYGSTRGAALGHSGGTLIRFSLFRSSGARRSRGAAAPTFRPFVEPLEDRAVPSASPTSLTRPKSTAVLARHTSSTTQMTHPVTLSGQLSGTWSQSTGSDGSTTQT